LSQADKKPSGEPLVVRDMTHMAQFVFDFYKHKLRRLAAQQAPPVSSTLCICHFVPSDHLRKVQLMPLPSENPVISCLV